MRLLWLQLPSSHAAWTSDTCVSQLTEVYLVAPSLELAPLWASASLDSSPVEFVSLAMEPQLENPNETCDRIFNARYRASCMLA